MPFHPDSRRPSPGILRDLLIEDPQPKGTRDRRTSAKLAAPFGVGESPRSAPQPRGPRATVWTTSCADANRLWHERGPRQLPDRLGFLTVPRLWGLPDSPQAQAVGFPTHTHRYSESPYGSSPLGSLLRSVRPPWTDFEPNVEPSNGSNALDQHICPLTCASVATERVTRQTAALRCPDGLGVGLSRQLTERPHDSAPRVRPYRQEVDDVDPVLAAPPLRAPSYVMSSHSRLSSSHSKVTVRDGKLPGTSRSAGCGAIVGSNADGISTPTKAAHLRVYPIASRSVSGRLASRRSKVESQGELLVHHGTLPPRVD